MLYLYLFLVMEDGASDTYLSLKIDSMDGRFKLTEGAINLAFSKYKLQNFVISRDCLIICELLGEGKIMR